MTGGGAFLGVFPILKFHFILLNYCFYIWQNNAAEHLCDSPHRSSFSVYYIT